jgi:replicative DNA helicase
VSIDDEEVSAGPGFERTPPNNIDAEQSVLGGMLLSKDAIADVVEVLRSDDFYRPAHQMIYDVVTDLYGRGEPADAVTVFDELQKRGEMARVGGAAYLHTLTAVVPTAANAGYYAKIVREQAILRRLIEAGTRIVSFGYGGQNEEVDDLVDRAQAEIYKVTERRTSEDYAALADIMPGALDELEAIGSRSGQMVGVPTGFQDLDQLTNGLHPGQMIVVAARPAIGKALALDTPLPTPAGWTTMGEVQVGDHLIGADGKPTRVVAATEVMHGRPCYEVEFSDGTVIVADAQHQWVTWDSALRKAYDDHRKPGSPAYPSDWPTWASSAASRKKYGSGDRARMRALRANGLTAAQAGVPLGRTATAVQQQWNRSDPCAGNEATARPRTTEEIARTLRVRGQHNHAIPAARALDAPLADLPIDPYVLGYLLGDGDSTGSGRVACDPQDRTWLLEEFRSAGYDAAPYADDGHFGVRRLRNTWCLLGLHRGKHVPDAYLRASFSQRLALVQGLIDSDGCVDGHGAYRFTNTDKRLVDGFLDLVRSLGCIPQVHHRVARMRDGRRTRDSWEVIVPAGVVLARLPRKMRQARHRWGREQESLYIRDVRPIESVPVRCVEVDNPAHLYLAGPGWVPTHNSTLGLDFARSAAIKHGMTTVIFSLEMSRNEITMRLLSAEARVSLQSMRSGMMGDDDWTRLARRMSEVAEAPLFIDDSPNMSMMEIRAKCRRLKQRNDLRFVIIDYLQLMSSPKKTESRQNEVSEISRAIKLLAKELEVPVIAISQLNRGPEQRTDKRPMVSDLRESGSIEQDADMVILLHREDAYERESPRAGEADLIVAKHRNGPTATVTVAFQGHYSRFVDMAQH